MTSQLATELGAPVWSRTDQILRLILFAFQSAFWSGKGREPEPIPMDANPLATKAATSGPSDEARQALARWRAGDITR